MAGEKTDADKQMTKLSPEAKEVLTAVTLKKYDVPPEGLPGFALEVAPLIASALRFAAYKVAPAKPVIDGCCEHREQTIRHRILTIAEELQALTADDLEALRDVDLGEQ